MNKLFFQTVLILFPIICDAQYRELYIPQIPTAINLEMEDQIYKEFNQTIQNIKNSEIWNIQKIHKKNFSIKIFHKKEHSLERCDAIARINGDWKDHIRFEDGIASLNIRLKNCNLGGISRFKLFLPETRNGNIEIFWVMFLQEYGFPTLYTQKIDVNLNGKSYQALLQEIPSTAFLERHGIREAPIIEYDEQQIWNGREHWFYNAFIKKITRRPDSSSPFKFWLDDDSFEYEAYGDFGFLDNKEFARSKLTSSITMRALSQYISQRNVLNNNFFHLINTIWAPHGLGSNKKYIYLPMINSFVPLYYDGMVNIRPDQKNVPVTSRYPAYLFEKCSAQEFYPNKNFLSEFKRRANEDLPSEMRCLYSNINKYLSHLSDWNDARMDVNIKTGHSPLDLNGVAVNKSRLKSGYKGIYMDMLIMRSGEYQLCKTNAYDQKCEKLDFENANRILTNRKTVKLGEHKFLSTVVAGELDPHIDNKGIAIDEPGIYQINVSKNQKFFIHTREGNGRIININLDGPGARAILYGELNNTDSITIAGNAPNIYKDSRHDELMLTGCLTFFNTKFNNPIIKSSAKGCEDAINILNSSGNIKNILINDADYDALDLDFSNLTIDQIDVKDAKNDCLDISTGNYEIGTANLMGCGDKAISAGEYAQVKLDIVSVNGATLGLIAKDGAEIIANQFQAINIVDKCLDTYIKKKRFPIGHINTGLNNCKVISQKR